MYQLSSSCISFWRTMRISLSVTHEIRAVVHDTNLQVLNSGSLHSIIGGINKLIQVYDTKCETSINCVEIAEILKKVGYYLIEKHGGHVAASKSESDNDKCSEQEAKED